MKNNQAKEVGRMSSLWANCLLVVTTGCAVHYYDARSGTEHLWGVGHMKMKVCLSNEDVKAVVKGTEVAGLNVGADEEGFSLAAGWDSRRRIYLSATNACLRLEWPDGDFFNVRIGSLPPFYTNLNQTQPQSR